jgi:hypothetical protein
MRSSVRMVPALLLAGVLLVGCSDSPSPSVTPSPPEPPATLKPGQAFVTVLVPGMT